MATLMTTDKSKYHKNLEAGEPTVQSVSINGTVTQVHCRWMHGGVMLYRCVVRDRCTGMEVTDLPCAGMGLNPGDQVTLTVTKQSLLDKPPFA
jgi:hypothetical protein